MKLPLLLKQASAGKEIVIALGNKTLIKLVPVPWQLGAECGGRDRVPGQLKGKIWWAPDAFSPLTDRELSELGFE